jgi:DNA-binding NarL/FixJ family response regulator
MSLELQTTPGEQRIVDLLLEGHDTREIASRMGLQEQGIRNRLRVIYRKAGISDGRKRVRLIDALSAKQEKLFLPTLTPRERQIAELVISGLTNPDIASRLDLSVQVVKNYLRAVFDKCGVWSRTELAARFRCA